MNNEQIRQVIREHYAAAAGEESTSGCGPACCGADPESSLRIGYAESDLATLPAGSNMGLGCGNPQTIASLREGETVLDLGSGGGIDCFLAGQRVGPEGSVIGVDMTPEMVSKARAAAERIGTANVEFRLGEIEHLPVADASIDVILSNCVVNLSPDKRQVFRECFRVLRPGGRLAIADVVAIGEVPDEVREHPELIAACVGGAAAVSEVEAMLLESGFEDVRIRVARETQEEVGRWFPGSGLESFVASAYIEARRPVPFAAATR